MTGIPPSCFSDTIRISWISRECCSSRVPSKTSRPPGLTAFISLLDACDWRLFRRSLVLVASSNKMVLRKLHGRAILHRVEVSSPPVFSSDFPDGDLKEKLAPIVTVRALEKLAEVDTRSTTYRVMSRDGNIAARLVL